MKSRADAVATAKSVKGEGLKGRVVRRYRDGAGWEFLVRFEGFDDEDSAKQACATLSRKAEGAFVVLGEKGGILHSTTADAEPAPAPAAGATPAKASPAKAAPVAPGHHLKAAMEAHGAARLALEDAERVKLVYTRELADGRIARHTYARRGTDLYLDVEAKKGEIATSTTIALGTQAWLIRGEDITEEDLQRSRQTIEKFGPMGAIPVVLSLERATEEAPEMGMLSERGTAKVADELCDVAGSLTDEQELLVAFARKDKLIRRISMNGGAQVIEYDRYRELGDAAVPHRVVTWRDGAIHNTIVIEEIEVDGDLPDTWFSPPTP